MSKDLSFREEFERLADTSAGVPTPSYSPVDVQIDRPGAFDKPVSLARLLQANGLGLGDAHKAVSRLAAQSRVTVTVHAADLRALLRQIVDLGLDASVVLDGGKFRVLVAEALLPKAPARAETQTSLPIALGAAHTAATVGDMRRLHGSAFAANFQSSARIGEILYALDTEALEAIASTDESDLMCAP